MKLTHPNTRLTITVREDMAEAYLTQGWTRAAAAPAKKAASKRAAKKAAKKAAATPPIPTP